MQTEKQTAAQRVEELKKQLKEAESATKENRLAYKALVNETVPNLVTSLIEISNSMSEMKATIFNSFKDIMELKAEAFGVTEDQATHTFTSTCGKTIIIGFRTIDGWDDTHSAGVAKVNRELEKMAQDENSSRLVKMIQKLLKRDDKGNLKLSRVIEVRKNAEELGNAELIDAVNIIMEAHRPMQSSWFVECYYKGENGAKISVPLSISSVDFPADYSFDFFNSNPE